MTPYSINGFGGIVSGIGLLLPNHLQNQYWLIIIWSQGHISTYILINLMRINIFSFKKISERMFCHKRSWLFRYRRIIIFSFWWHIKQPSNFCIIGLGNGLTRQWLGIITLPTDDQTLDSSEPSAGTVLTRNVYVLFQIFQLSVCLINVFKPGYNFQNSQRDLETCTENMWCSLASSEITWWRHQIETISALLTLCEISPATGEPP